jgi:hypothetical protein
MRRPAARFIMARAISEALVDDAQLAALLRIANNEERTTAAGAITSP